MNPHPILNTDRNIGRQTKTDRNISKPALLLSFDMSGRGGRHSGRGGCGNSGRGGRGRGRGQNYSGTSDALKRGLCTALSSNVFDCGLKAAADQMRILWEKLVQHHVGSNCGQDISNELQNKIAVTLAEPTHTAAVMVRHAIREQMIHNGQGNLQMARRAQRHIPQQAVAAGTNPEAPVKLAILENEIAQGEFEANVDVPIELADSEKTQHSNAWRTC